MTLARTCLFQVSLQGKSGLPEDRYVNTFHIDSTAADISGGEAISLANFVIGFYENPYDANTIQSFLGNQIGDDNHTIKVYRLADPTPRSPFYTEIFSLAIDQAAASHPAEVAVCLSYHSPLDGSAADKRRKGRIYLGPINLNATEDAGNDVRPSGTFIDTMALAADDLRTNIQTVADCRWVVYSPTEGDVSGITEGWVDNACDTQRRRGTDVSTRTYWP